MLAIDGRGYRPAYLDVVEGRDLGVHRLALHDVPRRLTRAERLPARIGLVPDRIALVEIADRYPVLAALPSTNPSAIDMRRAELPSDRVEMREQPADGKPSPGAGRGVSDLGRAPIRPERTPDGPPRRTGPSRTRSTILARARAGHAERDEREHWEERRVPFADMNRDHLAPLDDHAGEVLARSSR